MKKIYRNTAAILALSASFLTANAQESRSSYFMQNSNTRHQMNPALLDEGYVSMPLLGNFNVGFTGNVGLKNFIYDYNGAPGYDYTTFMNPAISSSEFLGELNDKNRLDMYMNINLMSVAFKAFKGVNIVELNLRSNTNICLPYELFDFMKNAGEKEHYSFSDLGMRTQNYMEIALGHSHKINEKITVGGKVKFLLGAAYADFTADKFDLTMNGDEWRIQADAKLKASLLNSQFEKNYDDVTPQESRPKVDGIDDTSFGLPGFGVAFDLGATYKVHEDVTISAGLTDLGFISWGKTNQASSRGDYSFKGFDNIYAGSGEKENNELGDQLESIGDDLEEMFSLYDDGQTSHVQALAATLNLGVEYTLPVYRPLRFGLLYTGRYHGLYSYHQAMLSANIRPAKWVEATVNTAYTSTGWTFGAALSLKAKHFNFFLGTDRFFGKLSKQGIPLDHSNGNVTLGMTFPL